MTFRNRGGGRSIYFADKDMPLRDDVSTVGALVGDVIRDQAGEEVFERVESCRLAAIERRESGDGRPLEAAVADLDGAAAGLLVRSFLTYFRVVNLAEQVHRLRRRRAYAREGREPAGSWRAVLRRLEASGHSLEEVHGLLGRLLFEPVFTAHPTEATRRSLLKKELTIAKVLVSRFDPSMTPPEEAAALDRLRGEATLSWQTEEQSGTRPTVRDEREHVLYHVTDVIYRVIPPLYEELQRALVSVWGERAEGLELPRLVTCSSWVGGDMDGNPYVSAETIRETQSEHRREIQGLYRR
ncbi:MAG: phosphoenolpyruvate carboxylase, partial [Acidobacteriota bacterium]